MDATSESNPSRLKTDRVADSAPTASNSDKNHLDLLLDLKDPVQDLLSMLLMSTATLKLFNFVPSSLVKFIYKFNFK